MRRLAVLLAICFPAMAQEAPVEKLHASLLEVMKVGPELGFAGRAQALEPVVAEVFDLPGMTRAAIGTQAARMSPGELDRLTEAFRRYTIANYARQFASWDGERFETGAPAPAHGGGQLVPTRIIPATGEPARLTYLMRERDGSWRINDILLDGTISQLAVRRSEFQAALKQGGASGLLSLLERRTAALAAP